MRKLILITFLAAAAAFAQSAAPASKAKVLSRAELDQLLATPDKVLVIDVRRPDEGGAVGAETYEKEGGTLTRIAVPKKVETAEK